MKETQNILSLQTIWKILKNNFKLFFIVVLLSLGLITAITFILPVTYTSTTTIIPPKENSANGGLSGFLQTLSSGGMGLDALSSKNSQSKFIGDVLSSKTIMNKLIDSLQLEKNELFLNLNREDIIEILQSNINVEIAKSGLITFTYDSKTKAFSNTSNQQNAAILSAKIANNAVKFLDEVLRNKNISTAKNTKKYIEQQILQYKIRLDSISIVMENFQNENKVISLDDQAKAIVTEAVNAGSDLLKAETELNLANIQFNSNSQYVETLKEQVEFLKKKTNQIQTGGLLENDKYSIPLNQLPKLVREYTDILRSKKIIEQVMLYLETQRHQEGIQAEKDIPVIEQLDKAEVPIRKSAPKRSALIILGFFVSLSIAILVVLINAYLKGKLIEEKLVEY